LDQGIGQAAADLIAVASSGLPGGAGAWWGLGLLAVALLAARAVRVRDRRLAAENRDQRASARERGTHRARLQYPYVDLTRCIGCATCIAACPEEGVLGIVHGQAVVMHGARCVGHGRCAVECPVGAIALTLGDVRERRDLPALSSSFEVKGRPNLFLAGEVTGYALIRTAVGHGTEVAREVARRDRLQSPEVLDLCVVGAGPAGLACSLEATRLGLRHVVLERADLGGTVAEYPRRKLVMTQPLDLPLHGRLKRTSYSKEELVELWSELAERHSLPLRTGVTFLGLEPDGEGGYLVQTGGGPVHARHVVLALGRRGTPRKLGVPGEELPKVAYQLIDAQSYRGQRILVVGGGDSAVEAAVGLAEQEGNRVTLSYRKREFTRLKARNEARLRQAAERGTVELRLETQVADIAEGHVSLRNGDPDAAPQTLANDLVFVFAGGEPPFPLLERCGVSFDPADREPERLVTEQGVGVRPALLATLAMLLVASVWVWSRRDYYLLDETARLTSAAHANLRPAWNFGLAFGLSAVVAVVVNLAYLLRRAAWFPFELGSLKLWMTVHVASGATALTLVALHAGLHFGDSLGGHAGLAMAVLVLTGAIGRYLYSFVPRAANGRELAVEEVETRLAALSPQWDREHPGLADEIGREIRAQVRQGGWSGSLPRRLFGLVAGQLRLRRGLAELKQRVRARGLTPAEVRDVLDLIRRAQRASFMASHFEELRGLLASWRYLHRWVALLMVLLLIVHVLNAVRFGDLGFGGAP